MDYLCIFQGLAFFLSTSKKRLLLLTLVNLPLAVSLVFPISGGAGGGGHGGIFPKKYLLPSQFAPKIVSYVFKLAKIQQFQHKNGKFLLALLAFFILPPKNLCSPFAPPQKKKLMLVPPLFSSGFQFAANIGPCQSLKYTQYLIKYFWISHQENDRIYTCNKPDEAVILLLCIYATLKKSSEPCHFLKVCV